MASESPKSTEADHVDRIRLESEAYHRCLKKGQELLENANLKVPNKKGKVCKDKADMETCGWQVKVVSPTESKGQIDPFGDRLKSKFMKDSDVYKVLATQLLKRKSGPDLEDYEAPECGIYAAPEVGVLILTHLRSPGFMKEYEDGGDIVHLTLGQSMSEIIFHLWEHVCALKKVSPFRLEKVVVGLLTNHETLLALGEANRVSGLDSSTQALVWGIKEEQALAMLGTPIGKIVVSLLLDNQQMLNEKTITQVQQEGSHGGTTVVTLEGR